MSPVIAEDEVALPAALAAEVAAAVWLLAAPWLSDRARVLLDGEDVGWLGVHPHGPRLALLVSRAVDDLTLADHKIDLTKNSAPVRLFSPAGTPAQHFAQFGWAGAAVPTAAFLEAPDEVLSLAPLRRLHFRDPRDHLASLMHCPHLGRLDGISLAQGRLHISHDVEVVLEQCQQLDRQYCLPYLPSPHFA